jgi:polar amino acid transport system ATP-binding protein
MKKVKEGDVGFVDQKYTLFRHKTIYDALYFSLRKTDISAEEKQQKIMTYLKDWGLEKCKDQYPNELSGGQRQRTAILEQLLNSSNYLVLDEPFSGLDVGNIQNVKDAIRLIDQTGDLNTVLFSTHDIELAVELADAIYVIGYPSNETVGTVVKYFDLKEMGIGWKQEFSEAHRDLCNDIKEVMLNS